MVLSLWAITITVRPENRKVVNSFLLDVIFLGVYHLKSTDLKSELAFGGSLIRFDSCWKHWDFIFPSMPVSLAEKKNHLNFTFKSTVVLYYHLTAWWFVIHFVVLLTEFQFNVSTSDEAAVTCTWHTLNKSKLLIKIRLKKVQNDNL